VRESLIPVCAPRLAAQIRSASDLGGKLLLHVVDAREDWIAWSKLAGVELPLPIRGPRFDTIQMALEAAAAGLGIAMGRLPLVEAEHAAGQLVAVLGPPRLCATGYWLVTEGSSRTRPEVTAFRDWIRQELGRPGERPNGPVPRRGQLARMSRMSA
jgi:DNA-binding transcriptional LysR family regulator